jgi:hypothetical protein
MVSLFKSSNNLAIPNNITLGQSYTNNNDTPSLILYTPNDYINLASQSSQPSSRPKPSSSQPSSRPSSQQNTEVKSETDLIKMKLFEYKRLSSGIYSGSFSAINSSAPSSTTKPTKPTKPTTTTTTNTDDSNIIGDISINGGNSSVVSKDLAWGKSLFIKASNIENISPLSNINNIKKFIKGGDLFLSAGKYLSNNDGSVKEFLNGGNVIIRGGIASCIGGKDSKAISNPGSIYFQTGKVNINNEYYKSYQTILHIDGVNKIINLHDNVLNFRSDISQSNNIIYYDNNFRGLVISGNKGGKLSAGFDIMDTTNTRNYNIDCGGVSVGGTINGKYDALLWDDVGNVTVPLMLQSSYLKVTESSEIEKLTVNETANFNCTINVNNGINVKSVSTASVTVPYNTSNTTINNFYTFPSTGIYMFMISNSSDQYSNNLIWSDNCTHVYMVAVCNNNQGSPMPAQVGSCIVGTNGNMVTLSNGTAGYSLNINIANNQCIANGTQCVYNCWWNKLF